MGLLVAKKSCELNKAMIAMVKPKPIYANFLNKDIILIRTFPFAVTSIWKWQK